MDKIDNQTIIHGNALEVLKTIPNESINLIVTDPPYNLNKDYQTTKDNMPFDEYIKFSKAWLRECKRILTANGTIYIFMGMKYISYIYNILERELNMNFNSWITWHYTQGIGKTKGFSPRHDDILMFTKNDNFIFNLDSIRIPQKYYRSINNMRGANPGNVWEFSHMHYCNTNRQAHPTQKPEALYERMILASSNPNDTILDPFAGSGTLLRVCQHSNRHGIGIEINEEYVKLIYNRLKNEFNGFDSIDERMKRCPNDLNDENIRNEYIKNHIKWFLTNHQDAIPDFCHEVEQKYKTKTKNNIIPLDNYNQSQLTLFN